LPLLFGSTYLQHIPFWALTGFGRSEENEMLIGSYWAWCSGWRLSPLPAGE
jgi:hypothetical protein